MLKGIGVDRQADAKEMDKTTDGEGKEDRTGSTGCKVVHAGPD